MIQRSVTGSMKLLQMAESTSKSFLVDLFCCFGFQSAESKGVRLIIVVYVCKFVFSLYHCCCSTILVQRSKTIFDWCGTTLFLIYIYPGTKYHME